MTERRRDKVSRDASSLAIGPSNVRWENGRLTGYWVETATAANAWLVITAVDASRGEVEAEMTF